MIGVAFALGSANGCTPAISSATSTPMFGPQGSATAVSVGPPLYESLPPLEVVRVDFPVAEATAEGWHDWSSDALRTQDMSLTNEGDELWLVTNSGLVRWDLSALEGAAVKELPSWSTPYGVLAIQPDRSFVVLTRGVMVNDQGEWVTLPLPDSLHLSTHAGLRAMGVDQDGALWLFFSSGYHGPTRCTGYPDEWECVTSAIERPMPVLDHVRGCAAGVSLRDLAGFWRCVTGPRGTVSTPLELPAAKDWRAVSRPQLHVTWDHVPPELVIYSLEPRQVVMAVPWPTDVGASRVSLVTPNDRQIWLFDGALWLFAAERWHRFKWPYEPPTDLIADPQGDGVWASVPALGLLHVSEDAARVYLPRNRFYMLPIERGWEPFRFRSPEEGVAVLSLAETVDGRIWAGTDGGGLWVYDEQERVWHPTDLTQAFVDILLADPDGGLWVGTRYGGVTHYDGQSAWNWYRIPQGLPSDIITALAYDQRGGSWAGTWDGGLARFDGQAWEPLETPGFVADGRITALVVDGGNRVFFGYRNGLGMYDGEAWIAEPAGWVPGRQPTGMVVDDQGVLWTSDGRDLYWYAPEEGRMVHHALPVVGVWALMADGDGRLWVGLPGRRLVALDTDETFSLPPWGEASALLRDRQGRLWVAGRRGVSMHESVLGK